MRMLFLWKSDRKEINEELKEARIPEWIYVLSIRG